MQLYIHEVCLCIFIFLPLIICKIEQIDYPAQLARCYNKYHDKTSIDRSVGYQIHFRCYQHYRLKTSTERKYKGKLFGLGNNEYISKVSDGLTHNQIRAKRQAATPPKRYRKEFRMMTDQERETYLNALQTLKTTPETVGNDTTSRFDLLAAFHSGDQLGAHGGCNFLPWHRAFLIMYEQALMQVNPSITLPYWDSTLDFYMDDPTQSIIWTEKFLGNGDGLVTSGTFRNWESSVGPLMRNIGVSGKLYSEEDISNVTSRTRYGEICGDAALPEHDAEFKHGTTHVWVDGQMGIIETAAYEPVFYMHHAFVDYIWEEFRKNQRRNGVDPTTDYPETFGDIFHAPDQDMGIGTMTVLDGLGDRFTRDIYDYEPRPTCTASRPDCNSKYLKCIAINGNFRCVSKTLAEYEADMRSQNNGGGNTDGGSTGTVNPGGENTSSGQCPTVAPPTVPTTEKVLHKPVQNSFCANGKADTREWVYLPIRVTYQRPPDFMKYESYPILNGKPLKGSDIYAPSAYNTVNKYIRPGRPENYGNCKSSNSGAGEMYIQSDGLNYDGTYREYAVIDHRLAISMSVAYVAVKAPHINDPSDVVISAFDSCGRVCHATCLIPGTNYYRPCSGALRVSADSQVPRMYGQNFGTSVLNVWDFTNNLSSSCPQFNIDQIYVSFFCDYSNKWPWEHARKQNIPPPPPMTPRRAATVANNNGKQSAPLTESHTTTQKHKCDVNGCIIEREDCQAPCENMVNYPCINKCNSFARCFYKKYYIQYCSWGHYDVTLKQCVRGQGHCTDEEYGHGNQSPHLGHHTHSHTNLRNFPAPHMQWRRPGFG